MFLTVLIVFAVIGLVGLVADPLSKRLARTKEESYHSYNYDTHQDEQHTRKVKGKGLDGVGYFVAAAAAVIVFAMGLALTIGNADARSAKSRCDQYQELGNEASWSRTGTFSFKCLVKHDGVWVPIEQIGIVSEGN